MQQSIPPSRPHPSGWHIEPPPLQPAQTQPHPSRSAESESGSQKAVVCPSESIACSHAPKEVVPECSRSRTCDHSRGSSLPWCSRARKRLKGAAGRRTNGAVAGIAISSWQWSGVGCDRSRTDTGYRRCRTDFAALAPFLVLLELARADARRGRAGSSRVTQSRRPTALAAFARVSRVTLSLSGSSRLRTTVRLVSMRRAMAASDRRFARMASRSCSAITRF
jgi:hypothetical protein